MILRTLLLNTLILLISQSSYAKNIDFTVLGSVHSSSTQNNRAMVKEAHTGKIHLLGKGQKLADNVQVMEIHRTFIIFQVAGKELEVPVGVEQSLDTHEFQAQAPTSSAQKATGLQLQDGKLEVAANYKEKMVSEDLPSILMQAASEPVMRDGQIVGFQLWDIEKDSIYQKAGFKDGDLITHINGIPLNDAGNAIKTLQSLRNAKNIEVTYEAATGGEKSLEIVVM